MIFYRIKIKYLRFLITITAAVLMANALVTESSDIVILKGDNVEFITPAIMQAAAVTTSGDKKPDTSKPASEVQLIVKKNSDKIKIRSCLIQLNNEQSVAQKYYPFLTSYFSTGT